MTNGMHEGAAAKTAEQPTPERFFSAVNAHQQTEAMKAAIELEVFTAIAEGKRTAFAIAERCKAAERGVRILCDFLAIHGFLTKESQRYGLAADSAAFLNKHSPAYLGGAIDFMLTGRIRKGHELMTDAVRLGGTALGQGTLVADNPDWVEFARAMMPLMSFPAEVMATELAKGGESKKVLDVAASHGVFGIAVARHNPAAEIYASDWGNVLAVAKENAAAAGIAGRHHLIPGDAFETEFGTGYDLVLITNFLHHFDIPTCTRFLKKVHAALAPGGRAAIVDLVPNDDRISPPTAAAFSLMMLTTTPTGDAYTLKEYEAMAKDAGFARTELTAPTIGLDRLIIAYK
ncbi:MAG TPA: class I SAM-dependent methyltransferase [Candidatus Dormibacteraeota bacterium]|jgi:2-polyprenyl-3-methyl-5-hydroxy-6-metoxy-1,4-benzoquinol methylase|nr:class I SAM-dependent methyltransferase [Candidatus Dormibacteraeota bacterium]